MFGDLCRLTPLILYVKVRYPISLFPDRNGDLILPDSQSAWSETHSTSQSLAKGKYFPGDEVVGA